MSTKKTGFVADLKFAVREYPRSFAYAMFWVAAIIGVTIWSWTNIGWWALVILVGCVVVRVTTDRVQKWAIRGDEADQ